MAEELPFRKEMVFEYGKPSELAPGVVRIVANNPSPFTYKGTNTYILGNGDELGLIDPGPDSAEHLAALLAAIGTRRLTHIIVTHTHHDHVEGLPALVAATGARTFGFGRMAADHGVRRSSPAGGEYVDNDFVPDVMLADGSRIEGPEFTLTALHTPGHAPDHLCFALEGTSLLFSGDHVMGWNTSVVAPPDGSMTAYMASLDRLLERNDEIYLPGHGGRVYQPQRLVKAFALHRRMREQSIYECIKAGERTIAGIVSVVYRGLDPRLVRAASLSVAAHVEHLVERGLVTCEGPASAPVSLEAV